jgi:hypothetical protein
MLHWFANFFHVLFCLELLLMSPYSHIAYADKPWSANPKLVEKLQSNGSGFNYDEAKVPKFTLPDPLVMASGKQVTTPEQWQKERRPELMELFRKYVYGYRPKTEYTITFEETGHIDDAVGGLAVGRSLNGIIAIGDRTFKFPFVAFVPKQSTGKVPAVVFINISSAITLEQGAREFNPFWPVKTLIENGYATAAFHTSDLDPDKADGYDRGVRSFFASAEPPKVDAWRSLSAWGWGASRLLDYLGTLENVDTGRAAVVGHSRGGKTSLWAAAEDERFQVAFSNNSGCGGAALNRRAYGETVARITTSFPHWFSGNFSNYAGRENDLPIDQHELIALIAPRAVYVASADEDLWADPKGEYASLVGAAPVFSLLGQSAIEDPTMPPLDSQSIVGKTGYHIRSGPHALGQSDWDQFLTFVGPILK